jgi:hypothetical protein
MGNRSHHQHETLHRPMREYVVTIHHSWENNPRSEQVSITDRNACRGKRDPPPLRLLTHGLPVIADSDLTVCYQAQADLLELADDMLAKIGQLPLLKTGSLSGTCGLREQILDKHSGYSFTIEVSSAPVRGASVGLTTGECATVIRYNPIWI